MYCLMVKLSVFHSLVPRLSLSLPFRLRSCEHYAQKIEGEGEPGTEPRPPVAFLKQILAQPQPGRPRVGTVPYQALPLLQFFTHNVRAGEI